VAVELGVLTADLAAESAELYEVLSVLAEPDWARSTTAAGWSVRDQITHLAFFDEAATLSAADPDRFRAEADELMAAGTDFPDRIAARFREVSGPEVFGWLQRARRAYLDTFGALPPATKLPWYGPPMSAASSVTARLMETWAHGQDVFDALGLVRRPTGRLRHVAHLGVATRGWSFRLRGLPVPEEPVRVELTAPDGGTWTWGPDAAADRVSGPAQDFCLLVVQRRHRAATALVATGPVADRWLDVAQAFAGEPGPGRPAPSEEPA
jgi:uncharacterized protein (TIGR03084 family)